MIKYFINDNLLGMEDNILKAALSLSSDLKNDPRVILLNQLEKELNDNDEAKILSYKMDMASMNYSDALKIYSRDSKEILPYIKALSIAKENLNNLEIVKKYNKAYQDVKSLYEEINEIVFNDYRSGLGVNK